MNQESGETFEERMMMGRERGKDRPVIVEIGPNINPVHRFSEEVAQKIRSGALYLGIDVDKEAFRREAVAKEIEEIRETLATISALLKDVKKPERVKERFVVADVKKLPLHDASVDEIWLLNVFSGFKNRPEIAADGAQFYHLGLGHIFTELVRVLKKDGMIHIGEFYPRHSERSLLSIADEDYSDLGLEKKAYKGDDLSKFLLEHQMRPFGIHKSVATPFFITLTKK